MCLFDLNSANPQCEIQAASYGLVFRPAQGIQNLYVASSRVTFAAFFSWSIVFGFTAGFSTTEKLVVNDWTEVGDNFDLRIRICISKWSIYFSYV